MSSDKEAQGVCPVDHSTREAWLKHSTKEYHEPAQAPVIPPVSEPAAEKCPVDHNSREVWLQQAKTLQTSNGGESFEEPAENCSSDRLDTTSTPQAIQSISSTTGLSTEREISTIPRAKNVGGNWVYPSQAQFFNAMKRKNWDPQAEDMQSVVPIHNAVNERAWTEILKWEDTFTKSNSQCAQPNLVKFSGDASKITPKARFNMTFLGFQKPFDRHDWLIERCGDENQQVEYVIDFYTGKPNPLLPDMPSFYLDVRPKLNTFEGCKMRFLKFIGWN